MCAEYFVLSIIFFVYDRRITMFLDPTFFHVRAISFFDLSPMLLLLLHFRPMFPLFSDLVPMTLRRPALIHSIRFAWFRPLRFIYRIVWAPLPLRRHPFGPRRRRRLFPKQRRKLRQDWLLYHRPHQESPWLHPNRELGVDWEPLERQHLNNDLHQLAPAGSTLMP